MKKTILTLILAGFACISGFAQDKFIRYHEDPSYEYIRQYMPEYYYEGFAVDEDPKLRQFGGANYIDVKVRVLHNYIDEKTFSYLILICGGEWRTLFRGEIDPLISYLNRVLDLLDKKPNDHNYYVFNSLSGIFFKTKWTRAATNPYSSNQPYYTLDISFPGGGSFTFTNKTQIQNFIYKLNAAKQYLPDERTDYLYNKERDNIKLELEETKEITV